MLMRRPCKVEHARGTQAQFAHGGSISLAACGTARSRVIMLANVCNPPIAAGGQIAHQLLGDVLIREADHMVDAGASANPISPRSESWRRAGACAFLTCAHQP